jgi:hypothetical protein
MVGAFAEEAHGGSDGEVSGKFAPGELELILFRPYIGSGAGDAVLAGGGVELC